MAIFRGVAAVLLLLLLISCSEGDSSSDPSEPTSQTTTTSTTPGPTGPVEPEPPEPTSKPTKASAIAFVKYFWEVVDYAQATGDTVTLKSLASPNCSFCRGGAKYLDRLRAKGAVVKSKPYTVTVTRTQLGTVGGGDIDIAAVTFRLGFPRAVEFYGAGDTRNQHIPGGRGTYQFTLEWTPSLMRWRVQMVVKA